MNRVAIPELLGNMSMLVFVDWAERSIEGDMLRVDAYESDRDGHVSSGTPEHHAIVDMSKLAMIRVRGMGGRGALVDYVLESVEKAARGVFRGMALQRLTQDIDKAMFAVDHADGHGLEVSKALRELWVLSGPDCWGRYSHRKTELLKWMEEMREQG